MDIAQFWNNQGVQMLVKGQAKASLKSFTRALEVLRAEPLPPTTTNPVECLPDGFVLQYHDIPGLQESSSIPVFDQAISLLMGDRRVLVAPCPAASMATYQLTTAVVIFNMAVAHHSMHAKSPEDMQLLSKANSLYRTAEECLESLDGIPDKNVLCLRMATINNSAILLQQSGDHPEAQESFRYLLHLMEYFFDYDACGRWATDCNPMCREIHTNALLGSLALLEGVDPRIAPAA